MAEDSDLERTEPATGRRIEMARGEGNVPRSRELATFAVTMTGLALLMATGDNIYQTLADIADRVFRFKPEILKTPELALELFKELLLEGLLVLAPIFAALFIIAAVTPLFVGGWNLTFKAIEPKFSKLNPLSGVKRLISLSALAEGGKAILKSLLIGGVATWVIWNERGDIVGLASMPLDVGLAKSVGLIEHTFLTVMGAMLLLVVIDVPLQLWQYHKSLRMTKEEIKQEFKEMEGSPEVKGRIRQLQREAARRRMMQQVPQANVIVTNPTHYAVALKYEEGMRAPQVVAKGSIKLAERIMELGREHRVAVMRTPSYARALYFNVEVGDDVPAPLYAATAQVLAYVYQLRVYEQGMGLAPVFPEELEFPSELDPANKRQQHGAPGGR